MGRRRRIAWLVSLGQLLLKRSGMPAILPAVYRIAGVLSSNGVHFESKDNMS